MCWQQFQSQRLSQIACHIATSSGRFAAIMKSNLILALLFATNILAGAEIKPIQKLTATERAARMETDARATLLYREGLHAVNQFLETQSEIFPSEKPKGARLLRREEKDVIWPAWQRFLEYTMALDSSERYHANWWRLKGPAREDSFLISYATMLANYRAALEFIRRAETNPELDKVLNDAVPELGLPPGTYA